jgi:hypothetical protein
MSLVLLTLSDWLLFWLLGNDELIQSLLFDAEATRGAVSSWLKENWDETIGGFTSSRLITVMFNFL